MYVDLSAYSKRGRSRPERGDVVARFEEIVRSRLPAPASRSDRGDGVGPAYVLRADKRLKVGGNGECLTGRGV